MFQKSLVKPNKILLLGGLAIFFCLLLKDLYADTPKFDPAADVNADGIVDKADLFLVSNSFAKSGPANCDVNKDGVVDNLDVLIVRQNFGKAIPKPLGLKVSPTATYPEEKVTITTTFQDANGVDDLLHLHLLVNTKITPEGGVFLYYDPKANKLYLRDDSNKEWLGGFAPTSLNLIENSRCILDCLWTTVSKPKGNTLTINWSIRFKPSFTGIKNTYIFARDTSNAQSGWVQKDDFCIYRRPIAPPEGIE